MSISKHISNKESVYSRTALRLGIENKPNEEQLANMKLLAEEVFEPLRAYVGGPIKINSFFRSPELNKAIGVVQNHNIVMVKQSILTTRLVDALTLKCLNL